MSADFADLHDDLRAVARDVLGRATPLGAGGDPAPVKWSLLADTGWLGLEVPEQFGGSGATFAETAVVLREMGRACAESPYLGAAVLGVGLLEALASCDGRDALLAAVGTGELRVAVAATAGEEPPGAEPSFRLEGDAGDLRLSGRADLVLEAVGADRLLVPASHPDGETVIACVEAGADGLALAAREVVDPSRSLAAVAASGVAVGGESVWRFAADPSEALRGLRDRGGLALACDSLGVAEAMLDATVDYVAARRQFDRPIGSFQAVKHACADMLVQVRLSQQLVAEAEAALVAGGPRAWVPTAMAKAHVTEAAVAVAGKAMQLHGGIGYTWERGVHAYLKRALLSRSLLGSPSVQRRRLAARYGESQHTGTSGVDRR